MTVNMAIPCAKNHKDEFGMPPKGCRRRTNRDESNKAASAPVSVCQSQRLCSSQYQSRKGWTDMLGCILLSFVSVLEGGPVAYLQLCQFLERLRVA